MANVAEKYGLRPVRKLDGSPFINAQNRYRIAANYGTPIYQGDLVKPVTGGGIQRAVANTTDLVVGVFKPDHHERFLTQRFYRTGRRSAENSLAALLEDLGRHQIEVLESEAEYVVFDSNVDLDAGWMKMPTHL